MKNRDAPSEGCFQKSDLFSAEAWGIIVKFRFGKEKSPDKWRRCLELEIYKMTSGGSIEKEYVQWARP